MQQNPWFHIKSDRSADLRLYCFPYAGGSAAIYAEWQRLLGPGIEVCAAQLPGRGNRFAEPAYGDIAPLAEAVTLAIAAQPDGPFAFFGHSMGALLAFEVTRRLAALGLPGPVVLFASGCAAPQARGPIRQFDQLDDVSLMAELGSYNATPPDILANTELMEMLLPMIRADFHLAGNYRYVPGEKLTLPIVVLAGRDDVRIEPSRAEQWSRETAGATEVQWIDGDHFFINSQRAAVLACVRSRLNMFRATARHVCADLYA